MSNSNICDYCDSTIYCNSAIYKAFDFAFCSPMCRIKKTSELEKVKKLPPMTNSSRYILEPSTHIKRQISYSTITIPKQIIIPEVYATSNKNNDEISMYKSR